MATDGKDSGLCREPGPATSCCCGPEVPETRPGEGRILDQPFVVGTVPTPTGDVPRVESALTGLDHWGGAKARWGVGRMRYAVEPGLYALGSPTKDAPVLVTANYKLSFDGLRRRLPGRNVWILVLDTAGINVWCAAGKGSFGTAELVERIRTSRLADVVEHRMIVVPQLGAPGVAGHVVRERTGFLVAYGPVRAADLPAYLDAGRVTSPAMRRKTFPLRERFVLIPMEIVPALKILLPVAAALLFLAGFGPSGGYWQNVAGSGVLGVLALGAALLGGAVLVPLLLPWLPGRAFSLKGLPVGVLLAGSVLLWRSGGRFDPLVSVESAAWLLLVPAVTTYLALNFTGASTYTSLSGVRKEMRRALPLQIGAAAAGVALWIAGRFVA